MDKKENNIEAAIVQKLLEKRIINKNQHTMARNIADTLGIKIETVLLEKGFITEEILFKILGDTEENFYGIIPPEIEKFMKKNDKIFNEINLKTNEFFACVGYIPDNTWENLAKKPAWLEYLSKKGLSKNDQYFILTNEPFNIHNNNLLKKLMSRITTKQQPKIFFMPSKKYKLFLLDIPKKYKILNDRVNILNNGDYENHINTGTLKEFLFESVMEYAIEIGGSDIHIEPDVKTLNFRVRKDGVMTFLCSIKDDYNDAVFQLINEKTEQNEVDGHKPLDGQFNLKHNIYGEINFRWGENRTIYGHHIVLRILNNDVQGLTLEKINYTEKNLKIIKKLLQEPNGSILITGPTGSGKTNTLAAILKYIAQPEIKILSLEDPVEIKLPLIQQVQVNTKNNLNAQNGLKSFLRQDPDVMFIGEIRDLEMGEHAIVGAMTGHLMLATLHTNDSLSSIIRLEDMGIHRTHIANTIKMVIAQRLIRTLCPVCKIEINSNKIMEDEKYTDFSINTRNKIYENNPNGCESCGHSGYSGRTPIAEIFVVDKQVQNLILKGEDLNKIMEAIKSHGFSDLKNEALEVINQGRTDIFEVIRVLGSNNQDNTFQYRDSSLESNETEIF
jgi:type II secretory ATPase GspE/PulE/Tfp pilus assembly ATPase PilB-like protein